MALSCVEFLVFQEFPVANIDLSLHSFCDAVGSGVVDVVDIVHAPGPSFSMLGGELSSILSEAMSG